MLTCQETQVAALLPAQEQVSAQVPEQVPAQIPAITHLLLLAYMITYAFVLCSFTNTLRHPFYMHKYTSFSYNVFIHLFVSVHMIRPWLHRIFLEMWASSRGCVRCRALRS